MRGATGKKAGSKDWRTEMAEGSARRLMAWRRTWLVAALAAIAALAVACGSEDRPGVEVISGSGSGSASGSASASASGSVSGPEGGDVEGAIGAYLPVSDVAAHSKVVLDVEEINGFLNSPPIDWAAVENLYVSGKNSIRSDGATRNIAGFARNEGRTEAIWDDYTAYYEDQTWLDTFVLSAIQGTGPFAGESDAVRRQGAQKGIQNQIMIAWVIHEFVVALDKARDGDFEPASGAPHNWDEAWAFYHGDSPGNSPFATAASRGNNFGTGNLVNAAFLRAMEQGRDALVDGNVDAAQAAMDEAIRQIQITYIQASIRYASLMSDDLANGDDAKAREHQAEGWTFFRVIEPMIAEVSQSAASEIASYYVLSSQPDPDAGEAVKSALESVYPALGIKLSDVGTLGGLVMGGYTPVSDVAAHARVVSDVAEINEFLNSPPIDWAAVEALYVNGKNSLRSDGATRNIAGFARNDGRSEAIWDDYTSYYNDQTWLDTFVLSAIQGTGPFAGESDAVRRQGAQKGIQNQIMIAWVIHELVVAMDKAREGNFDPASGAPHNWDEGWAFYHGIDPGNSPFATANSRGGNFGVGTAVNDALLQAMADGRDALVDGDVDAAQAATDEAIRQIRITYIQATIRYSSLIAGDLADGDDAKAREHQAEGWTFFRVIEPMVALANADAAAEIAGYLNLSAQPSADAKDAVKSALESIYSEWGISASEVGRLQ